MPPGPGPIVGAHRVLIASALGCAVVFTLYSVRAFAATGDVGSAFAAAVGFGGTIGIGIYFRSLRGLAAKLTPRTPER